MTIRMGDRFRDGNVILRVYGFRIEENAVDERRLLVVTGDGEQSEVDPWDLFESCILEASPDPEALICFDSNKHGKPILN